jgi:predicted AlkP superfamily phosphohydrolase/phosphomutase
LSSPLTSSRALIIGIDGGTWTVLRPAIERGYMPFLKSLVDTGASGVLMSTIPALTPPAWAAFQTGANPGKTGVFCFTSLDRTTRTNGFVSAELLSDTIWEVAGNAGKSVLAINLPMTYPARPVNGCMVTGLMTPSMRSEFTWPRELKAELLKAVPGYHIFNMEGVRDVPPPQNIPGFLSQMVEVLDNRTLAAEYLISTRKPDLCMVHFQTSDVVQHALWCYLDAGHSHFDNEKYTYIMTHFYQRLDKSIQRVHEAYGRAGEGFNTFVISDHGFEAYKYRFNLAIWLYQQGLLVPDERAHTPPWPKRITKALRIGRFLRFFVSPRSMAKLEDKLAISPDFVAWQRSPVFVTGFSSEAGIYIMQGDASQRAAIAQRIIEGLRDFRDPRTDKPIIEAIYRREEIYHGPRLELMPDLVVVPVREYMCDNHWRKTDSLIDEMRPEVEFVVGKHHPEGILVASGPGIARKTGMTAQIIDAAPTILYSIGVDTPASCDGEVIADLFTSEFATVRGAPRRGQPRKGPAEDLSGNVYSADDEKEIKKKLHDLGYM